jgi:hypothetical protein
MQLATECGKPVTTIKGVQFSRRSPTMGEVDYAVELLDAFLIKHRDTIYKAVNNMFKLRELEEEPPLPNYTYGDTPPLDGVYAWNVDVYCHIGNARLRDKDGFIKVRILRSGAIEISNNPTFTGTKPVSINVPASIRKKAKEFYEWQKKCDQTRAAANKYWEEAQKCEI